MRGPPERDPAAPSNRTSCNEEKYVGEVSIDVELREGRGKETNRRLRAAGRIPAVVYGHGIDPVALSLDPAQLDRKLRASHAGMNTLIDLTGVGALKGRTVLVKEIQREPIRGWPTHADFYAINVNETIEVEVPIHLKGDSPGVSLGGVIEHVLRELELECLPNAIPDEIIADVSNLGIGDSLHVSDLVLPEGVELLTDATLSVVSVMMPKSVEETIEAAAATDADNAAKAAAEAAEKDAEAKAEGDKES